MLEKKNGAFTLQYKNYDLHFLALWHMIAYISKIDLVTQQN